MSRNGPSQTFEAALISHVPSLWKHKSFFYSVFTPNRAFNVLQECELPMLGVSHETADRILSPS